MPSRARLLTAFALLVCLGLVAGAAHAGTVYVPLAGIQTVGTATWSAEVTIANPTAQAFPVSAAALLATDTDGTAPRGTPVQISPVAAGASLLLQPGAALTSGLIELTGSPNARYAARLTGTGAVGKMGVAIPVVGSAEMFAAASTLSLQGLSSSPTRTTTLDIVNLAKLSAQCTVNLVRYDGSTLGAAIPLTMKPLSQQVLANVFAGLDAAGFTNARARVSCTREFFAYALVSDSATGEISVARPSTSGESTLSVPGSEPECIAPNCSSSTLVFKPTPAAPVGHVIFPANPGTVKRLVLSLDVTVGQWYPGQPDGKHLIYWFVINKNLDMPGMLYFRGPTASVALVRWGIGLKHPQKLKATQPFVAEQGHTYHCVNDFNMGTGAYTVTITDVATGQVAAVVQGAPNVSSVTLKSGDHFLIDMGFAEGLVPDEVPSFNGWVYSKVRVEQFQ